MRKTILPVLLAIGCQGDDASEAPDIQPFRVNAGPACGTSFVSDGTFSIAMPPGFSVGTRAFRVQVPTGWDGLSPLPVVYGFHGCGGNEQSQNYQNLWTRSMLLAGEPVLVVTLDAEESCWEISPSEEDLPYLELVRSAIESTYCVDLDRVYFAGHSSGAFAAQAFGCRLGATAVISSSGGMHFPEGIGFGLTPSPMPETCARPVPVFISHGRLDTTVPVDRGRLARDRWLEINECSPTPDTTPAGNFIDQWCSTQAQPCVCERYEDCSSGAPVVYCEDNTGHTWPAMHRDTAVQWFDLWREPTDWPDLSCDTADTAPGSTTDLSTTGDPAESSSSTGAADASTSSESTGESSGTSGESSSGSEGSTGCELVCSCL